MDIYNYDNITGEYISTETAELDPLEFLPLIPAHATDVTVTTPTDGHVAVFDGTEWVDVEDNRGEVYHTETGVAQMHTELGALPPSLTNTPKQDGMVWSGTAWIDDNELLQQIQHAAIDQTFTNITQAGFATSNGIVMDLTDIDILRFDAGVRAIESLTLDTITIRDYNNVIHIDVPIATARAMVLELFIQHQMILQQKWDYQTTIANTSGRSTIEAILWV